MSRSSARWLVAPAPTSPVAPAPPPFLPPPGLSRPSGATTPPQRDPTSWPLALVRGVCATLLVALCGLFVWSVLPAAFGWHAQVVLTGSMQPRIRPGDLVLAAPVRPGDLQTGRIVLFRDPVHAGRTLVHRLIRFDDSGRMVTKGDANRNEDSTPVPTASALGLPRLRVPYVGLPVVWVHDHQRSKLLAATMVLTALLAGVLWPASPDRPVPAGRPASPARPNPGGARFTRSVRAPGGG